MAQAVVVLAAGAGTRMKASKPKVLHEVAGAPMLCHVVRTAKTLSPTRIVVVVGPQSDIIRHRLGDFNLEVEFATQQQPRGTADAVAAARTRLHGFTGRLIVLFGDTPLVRPQTLARLADAGDDKADIHVLGFHSENPQGYGRLVTGEDGEIVRIVENRDADPETQTIQFCNSGVIAGDSELIFGLIEDVTAENSANEYYLTDIIEIARSRNLRCAAIVCGETEALGVNDQADRAAAEAGFQSQARARAIANGVDLPDAEHVYFSFDTELAPNATIEPFVVFGPGVEVEDGARVRSFSHLEGCLIRSGASVGPHARIRPGSVIENGARVGNFVEVKQSRIGCGAKASHLSYIGDADIGDGANIGAGTITCNYDGKGKHRTVIGKRAFLGSDTILVAPVTVGESAMTAAGSVITSDVPAESLAVARKRQSIIKGFAQRYFGRIRLSGQ